MNKNRVKRTADLSGIAFFPALKAGIVESLGPGGFTLLLFFIIFLFFVLKNDHRPLRSGGFFIAGVGLAKILLVWGVFEGSLAVASFQTVLEVVYFVFAIVCVLIGGLLFREWWRVTFSPGTAKVFLAMPSPPFKKGKSWLAVACICGILTAFIEYAWPPETEFSLTLFQTVLLGRLTPPILLILAYVLSFLLPVAAFLSLAHFVFRSEQRFEIFKKFLSKVLIVFSAVFLAYGISFLHFCIKGWR